VTYHHTDTSVEHVCGHSVGLGIVSPVIVTAVSDDGRCASARIEVKAPRVRVQ